MISTVCKYTPIELFAGFGEQCSTIDHLAENFDLSDSVAHVNLCGFGKTVIQTALEGDADQLVLVNCCDVMRRSYEVIANNGPQQFLYLMDLPHSDGPCQIDTLQRSLKRCKNAYERYSGQSFDLKACQAAFSVPDIPHEPYIGIMGVRVGREMQDMISDLFDLPVHNLTCTGNRALYLSEEARKTDDEDVFFRGYAQALLAQMPCMRMTDHTARRHLFEDPNLHGIIYHSMKFCDFYGPEYAQVKTFATVPVLKIESDFTLQSKEQLCTRIEAFAETLAPKKESRTVSHTHQSHVATSAQYVAGIDSGSTSTDVVILNPDASIRASAIIPTGGGAQKSADACLAEALEEAHIDATEIRTVVATGYGRAYLDTKDSSITEITCHAKGAHFLNPEARTIIDIGGQDNKVISLNEQGQVQNFAMNDKCAAGTGRFLEMMANALQISLDDMSRLGLKWDEDITISSMCSVFAESEVVSLVAQNKAIPDIVHGLDNSVAAKINSLVKRVKGEAPYMMTGGVAQNTGVVHAIENKIGAPLFISDKAQLCGALGAALFALEQ